MATFKPIVSPDDVFSFMGTADDKRETHKNMIMNLIQDSQTELISQLGRQVESQTISSARALIEGDDFEFSNDYRRILLKGELIDLYTITALTEEGTTLTESTSYDDGGSFRFDKNNSVIHRIDSSWSTADFAITITGKYGYVNQSDDTPLGSIKLILTELVAMRSGLWKKTFISPDGTVVTEKDKVDKWLQNKIAGKRNVSLI